MRMLVVGNSVSESTSPGVPAYPQLLEQRLGGAWSVHSVVRSGQTIVELEPAVMSALATRFDRVVLQVGINDCAPRPLGLGERERLGRLRPEWLRSRIIRAIHVLRPHIIRTRSLQQFTPVAVFQATARRLVSAAQSAGARLLILPITTVTEVAERRTPFTNREVARYNAALASLASPAVRVATQREIFGSDDAAAIVASPETVHLSGAAHARVADYIVGWLQEGPSTPV